MKTIFDNSFQCRENVIKKKVILHKMFLNTQSIFSVNLHIQLYRPFIIKIFLFILIFPFTIVLKRKGKKKPLK